MARKRVTVKKKAVVKEKYEPGAAGTKRLVMVSYGDIGEQMGAYRSRKIYVVIGADGEIDTTADGYVVQLVEKNSTANKKVSPRGVKKNIGCADFEPFTSDTVKYMCDSYIERFIIKKGKLYKMSDEFTNGPIAKVEEGEAIVVTEPYEKADEPYETAGTITHKGTNMLFISPERKKALEALNWDIREEGPENGLYYLPIGDWRKVEAIGSDSINKPIHKVTATWTFSPSDTNLNVEFLNNPKLAKRGGAKKARRTYRAGL